MVYITNNLQSKLWNATLGVQEEVSLMEMGATVRNSCSYIDKVKSSSKEKEVVANNKVIMEKMSTGFYQMMGEMCTEVLQAKLHDNGAELWV